MEWHRQVRARLGFNDPPSYIQLLIWELTGIEFGPAANALAVVTLAASAFLGVAQRAGLEAIARQRVEPEDDVANFDELCDASSP